MKEGTFTYYTFQCRVARENTWLKNDALHEVNDLKWFYCSWDHFHFRTTPELSSDAHKVWSQTDNYGFSTYAFAKQALSKVRDMDEDGAYNRRDSYGALCQVVRHEFRIVKVILSYKVELV